MVSNVNKFFCLEDVWDKVFESLTSQYSLAKQSTKNKIEVWDNSYKNKIEKGKWLFYRIEPLNPNSASEILSGKIGGRHGAGKVVLELIRTLSIGNGLETEQQYLDGILQTMAKLFVYKNITHEIMSIDIEQLNQCTDTHTSETENVYKAIKKELADCINRFIESEHIKMPDCIENNHADEECSTQYLTVLIAQALVELDYSELSKAQKSIDDAIKTMKSALTEYCKNIIKSSDNQVYTPTNQWEEENKFLDVSGYWYHVHLKANDTQYIRIGKIIIDQDFNEEHYMHLKFNAENYDVLRYEPSNEQLVPNRLKRTIWQGKHYYLEDNGKIEGIYETQREFMGEYGDWHVNEGFYTGIHKFKIVDEDNDGDLTDEAIMIQGTFHDAAPSPKIGLIFMFRTPEARLEFLKENYGDVLRSKIKND